MNGAIENLIALIVAMSAATGGSANIDKIPDRPAIVAPAPASAGTVNQQHAEDVEINGVITAINGTAITVDGQTITLDANTKVEGKLIVGANVQVEGKSQNGNLVATQVEVKTKSLNSDDKHDDSNDKSIGSDDSKDKGSDDKGEDVNDDKGKGSDSDDKGKDVNDDKDKDGSSDDKGTDDSSDDDDDKSDD